MSGQWAGLLRAWEWSGYRFGDRMATIGGGSVSAPGGGGLRYRVYNLLRNNQAFAAADLDERGLRTTLAALEKAKPGLLYGYPSLLYLLASYARQQGAAVPRPRAIITTSEMLFRGQRGAIQEVFGAPVFDLYGCNEVNLVAAECDQHDGWHYAMESTIVEILDEHDKPVLPGSVGRIVGTALDNRMMPFVRYDTGDLGSLDVSPCRCGRGLVRLRTLQGRSRDLVRTPDGRFVHGVAFNDLVLAYPWVDRYQAVQLDGRRLRVILACRQDAAGAIRESLRQRLVELTGLEVELAINEPFEVTAGQKARVIVSKLEQIEGS
jgi:phenylacetate-CoA ligase